VDSVTVTTGSKPQGILTSKDLLTWIFARNLYPESTLVEKLTHVAVAIVGGASGAGSVIYLVSCKWYQSTFLGRNCGYFFFKVETYSGVFKPQRYVVTHINPRLRDSYTQEIQVVLKRTFVGHPCNPCWYPFEW
jgi:hypothetical protein